MHDPTLKEIVETRDKCAQIIALYGEQYLPIFERLEHEIQIIEQKNQLLRKALLISEESETQIVTQSVTQLKRDFSKASK